MGHGDRLAVVDGNYPARSLHPLTITVAGADTTHVIRAITTLLPIDDFSSPAVQFMTPDNQPEEMFPVHIEVLECLERAEQRTIPAVGVERGGLL